MAKLLYIDIETTGSDVNSCEILQLACATEDSGVLKQQLLINIKPSARCVWDDDVLAKHNIHLEVLEQYTDRDETFTSFIKYLAEFCRPNDYYDRYFLVGFNALFIENFLRKFFSDMSGSESAYGKWFWHPAIDVAQIVALRTMDSRHQLDSFNLGNICNALGIPYDMSGSYNSMYRVSKVRELFLKMVGKVG